VANPLNNDPPPLNYATPPPMVRPPMGGLIIGIFIACFLIAIGAAFCYASIFMTWIGIVGTLNRPALIWILLCLPLGLAFLFVGTLQFAGVVRRLRGIAPGSTRWERVWQILNRSWP
jgi:hypothetical protein